VSNASKGSTVPKLDLRRFKWPFIIVAVIVVGREVSEDVVRALIINVAVSSYIQVAVYLVVGVPLVAFFLWSGLSLLHMLQFFKNGTRGFHSREKRLTWLAFFLIGATICNIMQVIAAVLFSSSLFSRPSGFFGFLYLLGFATDCSAVLQIMLFRPPSSLSRSGSNQQNSSGKTNSHSTFNATDGVEMSNSSLSTVKNSAP